VLTQFFQNNWLKFFGAHPPDLIDLVPLTSCREEYGNDLILIFTNASQHPSYVFKICRNPQFSFKLKNEYSSLHKLSTIRELQAFIPIPIYCGDQNNRFFFIQKGIAGSSLFKLIKIHGINKLTSSLIEQSVDLLTRINGSVAHIPSELSLVKNNNCDFLHKYKEDFINRGVSKLQLNGLTTVLTNLQKQNKNLFGHGDYWPSNILVSEKDAEITGIIDWEFSSISTVPLDICWFLINLAYCLYQRNKSQSSITDAFKWAFFETGSHNSFLANLFLKYSTNFPHIKNNFSDMLKLSLAELSVRELSAYGTHTNMDGVCLNMLIYLIANENNIHPEYL